MAIADDPVMYIIGSMRLLGREFGWQDAPLNLGVRFAPGETEGEFYVIGNPRLVHVPNSPASEVKFFSDLAEAGVRGVLDEQYSTIWLTEVRAAAPLIRDLRRAHVRLLTAQERIRTGTLPDGALKPNVAAFAWDSVIYAAKAMGATRASSKQIKGVLRDALLEELPKAPARVLAVVASAAKDTLIWAARTVGETLAEFGHAATGGGFGTIAVVAVGGALYLSSQHSRR